MDNIKPTEKETFVLRKNLALIIEDMSNEQVGLLLRSIIAYENGDDNKHHLLDPSVKTAFAYEKAWLDYNSEKYQRVVERNRANGKKGGRPSTNEKSKDPSGFSGNPRKAKKAYSDIVIDSDIESVNEIQKEISSPSSMASKVEQHFLNHQMNNRFTSYPRERKAIKGLIQKADGHSKTTSDVFLWGMIKAFEELRKKEKFFRSQPFLPSSLNSIGIWDRVLNYAQEKYKRSQSVMDSDSLEKFL